MNVRKCRDDNATETGRYDFHADLAESGCTGSFVVIHNADFALDLVALNDLEVRVIVEFAFFRNSAVSKRC
jgi:hypothetical protein